MKILPIDNSDLLQGAVAELKSRGETHFTIFTLREENLSLNEISNQKIIEDLYRMHGILPVDVLSEVWKIV